MRASPTEGMRRHKALGDWLHADLMSLDAVGANLNSESHFMYEQIGQKAA